MECCVGGDVDWELSKENVLPLRQGRRVSVLNSSLHVGSASASSLHDHAVSRKFNQQRRLFELQIRTYCGADPLAPWHDYILWAEQHCPRGGQQGHLDRLLDNCISLFRPEQRYHQDTRYVRLWLLLARRCSMPLDVLRFMFRHELGTLRAELYIAWACHHELAGNFARADHVLAEGVRRLAQPSAALSEARDKLQQRVALGVARGKLPCQQGATQSGDVRRQNTTSGSGEGGGVDARRVLGVLRTEAGSAAVPRVRVGPALARATPGALNSSSSMPVDNNATTSTRRCNRALHVYRDSGGGGKEDCLAPMSTCVDAVSSAMSTALPTASHKQKENVRRAAPWSATDNERHRPSTRQQPRGRPQLMQAGCASGSRGVQSRTAAGGDVSTATAAGFRVFEDETVAINDAGGGQSTTAAKAALIERSSGVAAISTSGCDSGSGGSSWSGPVAAFETDDQRIKPMYCKSVIYCGVDEVSFEELRAVAWLRKHGMQDSAIEHVVGCRRGDETGGFTERDHYDGRRSVTPRSAKTTDTEDRSRPQVLGSVSPNVLASEPRRESGWKSRDNTANNKPTVTTDKMSHTSSAATAGGFTIYEDSSPDTDPDKDPDSDKENRPPACYVPPQTERSGELRRSSAASVLTDVTASVVSAVESSSPSSSAESSPSDSAVPSATAGQHRMSSQRRLQLDDVDAAEGVQDGSGDVTSSLYSSARDADPSDGRGDGSPHVKAVLSQSDGVSCCSAVSVTANFSRMIVGDSQGVALSSAE